MSDHRFADPNDDRTQPDAPGAATGIRVQCPNCCRLANVVRRSMGLLFYECELCRTVGAFAETDDTPE